MPKEHKEQKRQQFTPDSNLPPALRKTEGDLLKGSLGVEGIIPLVENALNTDYCSGFIDAAYIGTKLWNSPKESVRRVGRAILQRIDEYLGEPDEASFRYIIPVTNQEPEVIVRERARTVRNLDTVTKWMKSLSMTLTKRESRGLDATFYFPDLMTCFSNLSEAMKRSDLQKEGSLLSIVVNHKMLHDEKDAYNQALVTYDTALQTLIASQNNPLSLENPSQLLQLTKGMPDTNRFLPAIQDRKWNNVSYADLATQYDSQLLPIQILQYIQGIPHNNIFWRHVAQDAVLYEAIFDLGDKEMVNTSAFINASLENRGFLTRLYKAQNTLAEKILFPFIDPTKEDKQFDKIFSDSLANLQPTLVGMLANMVALQAFNGIYMLHAIQQQTSDEREKESLVGINVENEIRNSDFLLRLNTMLHEAYTLQRETASSEELASFFFKNYDHLLEKGIRERFSDNPNLELFLKHFSVRERVITAESASEYLYDQIKQHVGESFITALEPQAAEIQEVTQGMWEGMQKHIAYWPSDPEGSTIMASKGSFPAILGIKSVTFYGNQLGGALPVHILFEKPHMQFDGMLNVQGKLIDTSLSLPEGFHNLLEQVTVSQFSAFTKRNRILKTQEGITKKRPEKERDEQRSLRRHIRSIPRQTPTRIETADLYNYHLTPEQEPGTHQRVVAHTKHRKYALPFIQAVNHYNLVKESSETSEETLAAAASEIERTLAAFSPLDPTSTKAQELANLPEGLKTEAQPIINPLTGEEVLAKEWIAAYWRPPLSEEEKREEQAATPQRAWNIYKQRGATEMYIDGYWLTKLTSQYIPNMKTAEEKEA